MVITRTHASGVTYLDQRILSLLYNLSYQGNETTQNSHEGDKNP